MSSNCSTCSSKGTCDEKDDSDSCTTGTCSGGVRLPPGMTSIYNLDGAVERGTLIWAEVDNSSSEPRLSETVLQIINKSKSLWEERIFAVLMGPAEYRALADILFQHGVDTVYHVRGREAAFFDAVAYAESMKEIIDRVKPAAIFFGSSPRAQELAPRLAASIPCGLAADCTDLKAKGRHLQMIRPVYQGKFMAIIESDTLPQMATIRPEVFQKGEAQTSRKGTLINWPAKKSVMQEMIVSIKNDKVISE